MTFLYSIASTAYSYYLWARGQTTQTVPASPERLRNELENNPQFFQLKFEDQNHQIYTFLEYAVLVGDTYAVKEALGTYRVEPFSPISQASIAHFFIDCTRANCEMAAVSLLLVLLETLNSKGKGQEGEDVGINEISGRTSHTLLEHTLAHMTQQGRLDGPLIEVLLSKGSRIHNFYGTSPFTILKDANPPNSTLEKEDEIYFTHLIAYLALERKYHPKTTSALTWQEFFSRATYLKSSFREAILVNGFAALFLKYQKWFDSLVPTKDDYKNGFDEARLGNFVSQLERLDFPDAVTMRTQLQAWGCVERADPTPISLESAIKSDNLGAAQQALAAGAAVTTPQGSVVHFYIDCCDSSIGSQMLESLLEALVKVEHGIDSVNSSQHTVLEHALLHMVQKSRFNPSIVKLLLAKGVPFTNGFTLLKNCDYQAVFSQRKLYGQTVSPVQAEKFYFQDLTAYLAIEKKHDPQSSSALTHEEFAAKAHHLRSRFPLQQGSFSVQHCALFCHYIEWYNALVKSTEGFKKFFNTQELQGMIPGLKKMSTSTAARTMLQQLIDWGLGT